MEDGLDIHAKPAIYRVYLEIHAEPAIYRVYLAIHAEPAIYRVYVEKHLILEPSTPQETRNVSKY